MRGRQPAEGASAAGRSAGDTDTRSQEVLGCRPW